MRIVGDDAFPLESWQVSFEDRTATNTADSLDQDACIKKYTDVFGNTLLNENRMCLGRDHVAEHAQLPVEVRAEVVKFSEMNVRWLVKVLSLRKKVQASAQAIQRQALAVFAAIEGAQLAARGRGDGSVYDEIIEAYRTAGLFP
jgi:TetR/AcrR family transcriptional repressor of nem operon